MLAVMASSDRIPGLLKQSCDGYDYRQSFLYISKKINILGARY